MTRLSPPFAASVTRQPILLRYWAPLALTLLAAGLRVYRLEDFTANIDHAYPLAQAIGLVQSGRWPLLGQGTSILFSNPAGMSYAVLVPWLAFGSTWGVHLVVALLNVLVVPLTWRLVQGVAGRPHPGAANAAAALAAVNPWLIHYSRGAWVQGLVPLWATLAFALLAGALFSPRLAGPRRAALLFAGLLALTALTQMYLLAFLEVAPAALVVWLGRARLAEPRMRRALLGGLAVLGLATALFAWELWRDWPAQSQRLARFSAPGAPLMLQRAPLDHAARLVTGRDYEIAWGNDGGPAWQQRRIISLVLSTLLAAALAAGLARALLSGLRRQPAAGFWASAVLWWAVPVLGMSVTRHPVHIVYLVLTVPAGYVLAAPVLAWARRRWWGAALACLLAAHSLALLDAGGALAAARPVGASLDEMPLAAADEFGRHVRALAERHQLQEVYVPLEAATLTARTGLDLTAVNWVNLPAVPQFTVGRPSLYVQLGRGAPPPGLRLAERVDLLEFPGADFVAFDFIPAYSRAGVSALPQHTVEWTSEQGLTLVGYDEPDVDGWLRLYYAVDALAPDRHEWLYAPYAHVIDGTGQLLANVSAPGLPGYYYRAADVFMAEMQLPSLPAGRYRLELGLFDGLHGAGVTFLSPDGPIGFYETEVVIDGSW